MEFLTLNLLKQRSQQTNNKEEIFYFIIFFFCYMNTHYSQPNAHFDTGKMGKRIHMFDYNIKTRFEGCLS